MTARGASLGKATRQRAAVADALGSAEGFRSAQEIYDELRDAGIRIGLTTVYRTLQSLSEVGEVDSLRSEDGETIYRRCSVGDHHHHLICRSCGWSMELASDEIERWAEASARSHGFSDVTHEVEIFGLCADCSPRRRTRRP